MAGLLIENDMVAGPSSKIQKHEACDGAPFDDSDSTGDICDAGALQASSVLCLGVLSRSCIL